MPSLFDLADLAAFTQGDLDTATASQCRSMATGVVLGVTGLVELPDPVPEPMATVGKRVAARLYENPTALKSETLSGYSANYGDLLEDIDRLVLSAYEPNSGLLSMPLRPRWGC
jgi:hypothetical protein